MLSIIILMEKLKRKRLKLINVIKLIKIIHPMTQMIILPISLKMIISISIKEKSKYLILFKKKLNTFLTYRKIKISITIMKKLITY
jgi:hypothetical protein